MKFHFLILYATCTQGRSADSWVWVIGLKRVNCCNTDFEHWNILPFFKPALHHTRGDTRTGGRCSAQQGENTIKNTIQVQNPPLNHTLTSYAAARGLKFTKMSSQNLTNIPSTISVNIEQYPSIFSNIHECLTISSNI